jgi:hypothetical protein
MHKGKGGRGVSIAERQYIKDTLFDVFTALLAEEGIGVPLIWENSNGPRPVPPFLSLELREAVTEGTPNKSKVRLLEGGAPQIYSIPVRRGMTLHGFGEAACDILETVKSRLETDYWTDALRQRNLVIPQIMETAEIPGTVGTTRENRAEMDFDLTYTRVTETEPGYIEHVEITDDISASA